MVGNRARAKPVARSVRGATKVNAALYQPTTASPLIRESMTMSILEYIGSKRPFSAKGTVVGGHVRAV